MPFFPQVDVKIPAWLNPKKFENWYESSCETRFNNELGKPLHVETCAEEIIGWILDVFLDAAIDFDIIQKLRVSSKPCFPQLKSGRKRKME